MKLLSLKFLNFRRFREEEIIFRDDFSLIFWKNWAWKSTIIDWIWYALFWPTSKDFVRVNTTMLKSFFVTERLPSKIELNFSFWLDNYKIVRVIDPGIKKFSSEFITENKDTLYWPNSLEIIWWWEINDFIVKIIWVSRDTFLRSVFAKQKDLEVLSWMSQDRKRLINSILWLDKIENLIIVLKQEEKEKSNFLNFTKSRIEQIDIEEIKKSLEIVKISENEIKIKLSNEEKSLKDLNKDFENSKILYEKENKKREEYLQLNNEITSLKKILEELQIQNKNIEVNLESIKEKEKYLKDNDSIIAKEKKLSEDLSILQNAKNLFEKKILLEKKLTENSKNEEIINKNLESLGNLNIQNEIEKSELELSKKDEELKKINDEKVTQENKISYLRKEYEDIKKEYEQIKNLTWNATCPTCLRPLEWHFENILKMYEEKLLLKAESWKKERIVLEDILKKLELASNFIENLKKDLNILKQKEKDFIKFSENKNSILKEKTIILEELKDIWEINYDEKMFLSLKTEYEQIKSQYLEYLKIQWEVRNKEKLEENKKTNLEKIREINEKLSKSQEYILKIEYLEETFEKVKESFFTFSNSIKEKNENIQTIIKEKSKIEYELKNINNQIEEYKKDNENIKNLVWEVDYIKQKIKILWDYIIYLLEFLKPKIEDLASQYFAIITDSKYNYITLDNEYNILIDGKNIDLFSGWERDLANLCLRLSLWQNLSLSRWNPINFLVLDEVLGSQDKDRQQNILINLKKLENKFSQIILISHLEEIKDLATNLIEVKAISKDESKVNYY